MISRRDLLRALGALPIISRTRGLAAGDLRYRLLGRPWANCARRLGALGPAGAILAIDGVNMSELPEY
jgi:hypothetical protein